MAAMQRASTGSTPKRKLLHDPSPEQNRPRTQPGSKIMKFLKDKNNPLTSTIEKEFKAFMKQENVKLNQNTAKPFLTPRKSAISGASSQLASSSAVDADNLASAIDDDFTTSQNTDNLNWSFPKKFVPNKNHENTTQPVPTLNKFNSLADEHLLQKDAADQPTPAAHTQNGNVKKVRAPPIYCTHNSTKSLVKILSESGQKCAFHVKDLKNNNEQIVQTDNLEHHNVIRKILEDKKIPFYTYTPQIQKNKILVLKGLHSDYTTEDVKNEINKLSLTDINVLKVDKLAYDKTNSLNFHF